MLDVHPPHHAASTWRDFFIHIATIVIGLLIAIGLEQTVEYIHHRHQLKEARLALEEEKQANLVTFRKGIVTFEEARKSLQSYAATVRASIENPAEVVPAFPPFGTYKSSQYTAWTTAQRSGALTLMRDTEQTRTDNLYADLRALNNGESKSFADLMHTLAVFSLDPNPAQSHPGPEESPLSRSDPTDRRRRPDHIAGIRSSVQRSRFSILPAELPRAEPYARTRLSHVSPLNSADKTQPHTVETT